MKHSTSRLSRSSLFLILMACSLHSIQCTPSIEPHKNFDAKADANAIKDAFDGGVDKAALKEILSTRSCEQRMEITHAFKDSFIEDLEEVMARHTGGTYEQLLKDSLVCGDALMAMHLRRGLTRYRRVRFKDKKNIIEIMVVYSESAQTHANLTNAYEKAYGRKLIDDIKHELRHDFKHVMEEMATRVRRSKEPTDENKARETAQKLHDGRKKWGNDRQFLDATLMETPFEQLELVFQKFKEIDGHELEHVIKEKLEGRLRNAYQDLIHFCKTYKEHFVEYFATRFFEAVDRDGTDEQTLIRLTLYHSETDLRDIQKQFQKSYNRDLATKIGHDTSGAFEGLLRAFITGNTPTNAPPNTPPNAPSNAPPNPPPNAPSPNPPPNAPSPNPPPNPPPN